MSDFGKTKDWMPREGDVYCDNCAKDRQVKATYRATYGGAEVLDADYLCKDCYERHVITSEAESETQSVVAKAIINTSIMQ